jgi:hypothetical protein
VHPAAPKNEDGILKKTIYGLATEDRGLFLQGDILKKQKKI